MKVNWEHILKNKFNYLLTIQIVIFICYPILHSFEATFPIISLLMLLSITPALWVGLSRGLFLTVISIGVLGYTLNILFHIGKVRLADEGVLVLLFLYAVFYFLAITFLIRKISSNTTITSDTIKGGISIYILLGMFWTLLYLIVLQFNPDAINNIGQEQDTTAFNCFYFSFATLTTLGYGDIAPIGKYARILAMLEAITGPVYLAIFVAQIIGLNIARKLKE